MEAEEPVVKSSSSSNPSLNQVHEAIARRATEIYEHSGRIPGRDMENWVQAEAEILRELSERPAAKRAVMVRVNGVQYIGEYVPESADGYTPGEFSPSDQISVRIEGDKMFVQRPNGKELETKIVKKVG
jgi:Protein of unknown function (DUF2934)